MASFPPLRAEGQGQGPLRCRSVAVVSAALLDDAVKLYDAMDDERQSCGIHRTTLLQPHTPPHLRQTLRCSSLTLTLLLDLLLLYKDMSLPARLFGTRGHPHSLVCVCVSIERGYTTTLLELSCC